MISPSSQRSAAPTRNLEYGQYARDFADMQVSERVLSSSAVRPWRSVEADIVFIFSDSNGILKYSSLIKGVVGVGIMGEECFDSALEACLLTKGLKRGEIKRMRY